MRLVQLRIPEDRLDTVREELDERQTAYALFTDHSKSTAGVVLSVPMETDEVESFLDSLRDIGIEYDEYAVVSDLETNLANESEAAEPDVTDDHDEDVAGLLTSGRISREELQSDAREMAAITPKYLFFTVVSAIVAGAGLLTNSVAVIVGSMVIAPLLGPAVGASVGSIVNDEKLFRTSVLAQIVGVVLAIVSATVFAIGTKLTVMPEVNLLTIDEIASRINPGALSLVVALGSGAAGAFSISAGASAPLVGVMIAAALIPPAAAVGLAIAYWNQVVLLSVTILLVVNVLSINLASLVVLYARGYRPSHWYDEQIARQETLKRFGTLLAVLLIVSVFLFTTSVNIRENAAFESTVSDVLEESNETILAKNIEYKTGMLGRHPDRIVVHVDTGRSGLATELHSDITRRTDDSVSVTVIRENTETAGTIHEKN